MRTPWPLPLLAVGVICACGGSFAPGDDPDGDPEAVARSRFESQVQPILTGTCIACHATAGSVGPGFLQPMPDIYSTVRAWPNLVKGGQPNDSRLYTYSTSSNHQQTGTNLMAAQAAIVRDWIAIVPPLDGEGGDDDKETPLLTPSDGPNVVSLDGVAEGINGAKLTFNGDQLTAGFLITQLQAHAGASGLHLVHPLFIMWCDQQPTPIDAFDGVDLDVEPNMQSTIGGGTLSLSSFTPGCLYTVHFEILEPSTGGGGGDGDGGGGIVTGGCTSVATFTANAQPPMQATCARCHGMPGNIAANAFDLTALDDLSADGQANACAQTRGNINLTTPDTSILFRRVEPGQQTGHPFEFPAAGDFTGFKNSVLAWVANETP
jgi:hypothetical protein